LRVQYRALDDAPGLYPLQLRLSIPWEQDPLGQQVVEHTVVGGSTGELQITVPPTPHSILDLRLQTSRISGPTGQRAAAALWIESITFAPAPR
jgi:hypothetical protein